MEALKQYQTAKSFINVFMVHLFKTQPFQNYFDTSSCFRAISYLIRPGETIHGLQVFIEILLIRITRTNLRTHKNILKVTQTCNT